MNKSFVYRGVLVLFDETIGYFFNLDGIKLSFREKQKCLDFISGIK